MVNPACANGHYLDRGPALPIGDKAKCSWCGSACWNRGCSACTLNFHKTCYYGHLSKAKVAAGQSSSTGKKYAIPPKVLEEKELQPFLTSVGMLEYMPMLTKSGIHGIADLVLIDEEYLKQSGMTKVIHRRKLLRQIAQYQATIHGVQHEEEEPCILLELEVRKEHPDVKLGLVLSETNNSVVVKEVNTGSVGAVAGFEPLMTIMKIDEANINSQEDFMRAIHQRISFKATVKPQGGVMPPTTFERLFPKARDGHVRAQDFEKLRMLGTGASSEVYLVRNKESRQLFAMKTLDKRMVLSAGTDENPNWKRDLIMRERDMMKHTQWAHDGLVKLHHTFQSPTHLCFILDYCPGGDLYEYMSTCENQRLTEDLARYYAAQVFIALRTLHKCGIVYRDLKPENILLDANGNAKLADFGLSRPLAWGDRATTFIGTPEYMAPEMIEGKPYSYAVDWWAYGVVIYNLLTGEQPFDGSSTADGTVPSDAIWKSILETRPTVPTSYGISNEGRAFVEDFLEKEPDHRLEGEVIRRQPWFKSVDWYAIENGESRPPVWSAPVQMVTSDDAEKLEGWAFNSPIQAGPPLDPEQQAMFQGFSYSKDANAMMRPPP
eukprot:TRINITY_DN358_c11_g1_i1.p1 TRINITY_DN358_c11_g1~~TRINITY_DN358_c11_g1_i1.p1  ORF type:complete len:605 (+),score=126.19 TRINITY_DN358_c11_g1_i1:122-1936(+)